jgi:DNA polymerase II small subunit/DNA polymerase delta subunit B
VVLRFLGTSGQNIDDLEKYSEAKDKLEFVERTLRWRHLAPTTPNTLGISIVLSAICLFFSFCNIIGH